MAYKTYNISPTIVYASLNIIGDPNWFSDSGVLYHVTSDPLNLTISTKLTRNEQLQTGNGTGLPIAYIVMTLFTFYIFGDKKLALNNLLHVPSIAKNLLSVSQFTKDNDMYVEFHPDSCHVKDKKTCLKLVQETVRNGLYIF